MKKFWLISIAIWFVLATAAAQPPAGYYNGATGLTGAALKTALYNIIKDHTSVAYDNIWTRFQSTDPVPGQPNKVWDMYSNCNFTFVTNQCGTYTTECQCFNREHSFPTSWYGGGSPMYTDLFHVYPTDGWVNSVRNNYPYGVVANPTLTTGNGGKRGPNTTAGYSQTVFEPIDQYKGDLARTYFYMATRYENLIAGWHANSAQAAAVLENNSFPAYKQWYLNLMLQWHEQDPVSQKEIDRNNAVAAIQGNRNPFIDNPSYATCIWATCLASEPQHHAAALSASTITLTWADATGAVVPTGYLVRMSHQGFDAIAAPINGTPVANDHRNKNVPQGTRTVTFGQLAPGTTYYFKIYGYTGSGATIKYKTSGTVPQASMVAR